MIDVSVLITCFNKEPFLEDCLSSLSRQTKQPKEIILVHDACENPQAHVLADTLILRNNLGVVRARHEAFRHSTGSLILFLDADDVLSPDYLEKMTLLLAKGADVVYPDLYLWGTQKKLSILPNRMTPKIVRKLNKLPVPVTSLIRRELYENLNGFRDFPVLEDLDFWLRAMCKGYTFKKAQTLLWYRATPDSRNTIDEQKKKKIFLEIMGQFDITDSEVRLKDGR